MGSDRRPLDQPVELIIRGDRMDVLGFVAGIDVALNSEVDALGDAEGRGAQVAEQVTDRMLREENLELFGRDLEKADREDEVPTFRGVDIVYGEFDPKHPDADLAVEDLELADVDAYIVAAYDESEGFIGSGYPEQMDVVQSFAFASFLRSYARSIEDELEATMGVE